MVLSDVINVLGGDFSSNEVVEFMEMSTMMLIKLLDIEGIKEKIKILSEQSKNIFEKCMKLISLIADVEQNVKVKEENRVKITRILLNCLNIFDFINGS